MAYFQILAIVLCAYFLQNAYAPRPAAGIKRSSQKNAVAAKSLGSESTSLASNKYPNLSEVETKFWKVWNEINTENQYGKLSVRGARNMFEDMLNNENVWSMLNNVFHKYNKATHDRKKADKKVKLSNVLGNMLTLPIAKQDNIPIFTMAASDMYNAMVQIESEVCEDALQHTIDVVNDGSVADILKKSSKFVKHTKLKPLRLHQFALRLKELLELGGTLQLGDGLAGGVMSLVNAVTGENKTRKPKSRKR